MASLCTLWLMGLAEPFSLLGIYQPPACELTAFQTFKSEWLRYLLRFLFDSCRQVVSLHLLNCVAESLSQDLLPLQQAYGK